MSLPVDSPRVQSKVVVLGSSMPGSIMALVLAQLGFEVTVIEKGSHPRFAIGESSTPTADIYLRKLAEEFEIPELAALSTYAGTRRSFPQLNVGLKRGFSYFWHAPGQEFAAGDQHQNEMIVAASASDASADSQWDRADVDTFLVSLFDRYGVSYWDQAQVCNIKQAENYGQADFWHIHFRRNGQETQLAADYFIDATGRSGVGILSQGGESAIEDLTTDTSAIFAHFNGLERWSEFIDDTSEHPFDCDQAAVHHLFDGGWMWQLRFDNGVTSCGIVHPNRTKDRAAESCSQTADEAAFRKCLSHYPSLAKQFESAHSVDLASEDHCQQFHQVDRIQHLFNRGSGPRWCSLPNTIGFVDPLHSKGLAHAFSGVFRLGKAFQRMMQPYDNDFEKSIQKLMFTFRSEIIFLDRLISIGYRTIDHFQRFRLATFWYFIAATNFEIARSQDGQFDEPFLFSDHQKFRDRLFEFHALLHQPDNELIPLAELDHQTRSLLSEFDQVGLFSPARPNMYARTAAPEK